MDFGLFIKRLILATRWLLMPLYLGLGISMVAFVVKFFQELYDILSRIFSAHETEVLLHVLSLIDIVLVANLLVMVIISGYETFVAPLRIHDSEAPGWLSKLDPGTVKIKLASSVVSISLIRLLTMYLKSENFSSEQLKWSVIVHCVFIFTVLGLAFVDKLTSEKNGDFHS